MSSAVGYLEDSVALAVFASDDVDLAVGLGHGRRRQMQPARPEPRSTGRCARHDKEPKVCIVPDRGQYGQQVDRGPARRASAGRADRRRRCRPHRRWAGCHLPVLRRASVASTGRRDPDLGRTSRVLECGWNGLANPGPSGTVTRSSYGGSTRSMAGRGRLGERLPGPVSRTEHVRKSAGHPGSRRR